MLKLTDEQKRIWLCGLAAGLGEVMNLFGEAVSAIEWPESDAEKLDRHAISVRDGLNGTLAILTAGLPGIEEVDDARDA